MNITVVYGQNHKGSTYHITRMLTEKLKGNVTEFFLPKDFSLFCVGCNNCFAKSEALCPHFKELEKITEALDIADVIILASPVYVYHATGSMKAFLDHYGYRWMVHRPEEKMFSKIAVVLSSAAGAGMKSTNKDMADSLFFWGIAKTYRYGIAIRSISWDQVDLATKKKIERKITSLANKIENNLHKVKPSIKTKAFFEIVRMLQKKGWNSADVAYWSEKKWNQKNRPWKNKDPF